MLILKFYVKNLFWHLFPINLFNRFAHSAGPGLSKPGKNVAVFLGAFVCFFDLGAYLENILNLKNTHKNQLNFNDFGG